MRILAALTAALVLTGCATNEADRAFFNEGWTHPEEASERRMNSSAW